VDKVAQLEDQLFRMDQEFEAQSGKIQKRFDQKLRDELERVRKKVKEEYQFTLDIKVQEERSKMLAEKLDFVGSVNGDKDIELVELRLKQTQVQSTNRKLEEALETAKAELDRIQNLTQQKPWWPF
jgi:myosin heavy subunit